MTRLIGGLLGLLIVWMPLASQAALPNAVGIETPFIKVQVSPDDGRYEIADLAGGVTWQSNPYKARFGEIVVHLDGKRQGIELGKCEVKSTGQMLEATFRPLPQKDAWVRVKMTAKGEGKALEFSYEASQGLTVESIRLLEDALAVTAGEQGYLAVPVREGMLIPADSGLAFTHGFDTYAYEGCHMTMLGAVKSGAAALITWEDPYVLPEVRSTLPNAEASKQTLSLSMLMRKSAKACTVQFLGKGDYVSIAKAYREIAQQKGWLVTWDQKLQGHPERAKYFGAINYKLWSTLDRRMNEDSTKEERVSVNWTFDEVGQIAEHLKNDLKLDRVLFMIGGWIHRGYDNQHPDILPAAPECGGDAKLAEAAKRVKNCGYLFSLHDNYQDMYKDSPSWDESYLQKHPDGKAVRGGHWAGGFAYITCAQKAVELAKRPQNLSAVKKLTDADSYFIDTTYAAGLQECFDPKHPLTRADDMKWKQAISDYAREVFGSFGSECGREWAIPHADFFEGMTGVSGTYYHDANLVKKLGATVVPLFEIVYRDCIAMYGKYGYDIHSSAEYVLHHLSIGRPMHYHSIPAHLYWKQPGAEPLQLQPVVADFQQTGPRQFAIAYDWKVGKALGEDWAVFVHFTDSAGQIKFQGDYKTNPILAQWQPGTVRQGPFTVHVPENLNGTFDVRIGLWKVNGPRATLLGPKDRERRCLLGKVKVENGKIEFTPRATPSSEPTDGDPALFVRGDNGWSADLHPMDRFVKNTYEILSPLNELTSQMRMTEHRFLTADRKVRLSVFGEGSAKVSVVVNGAPQEYRLKAQLGGSMVLPPNGFVIDSPQFMAFCATEWNGVSYESPTLFTLRSLDGKPIDQSSRVRVFHGFGDARIQTAAGVQTAEKEAVISWR